MPGIMAVEKNPSFVLQKAQSVTFENRPVPTLEPHDVLVHVHYTGICGSDVHYWKHGAIGQYVVKDPMVLGHESSGIVTATGSLVRNITVGDRVALEPGIPCRRCTRCRAGKYNLCFDMKFAATPPIDGTLAKYYKLPEDFCYKLADDVSLEEGALAEPLSVAVHIVRQAELKPGSNVVVFGAGPVGLLCCAVARVFGADKIVCVDISSDRLAFAKGYAATHTYLSRKETAEEAGRAILEKSAIEGGADVAIDATGAEPCIQTCIEVLRAGGVYVQAGMGRSNISFPVGMFCNKEITAKGSFRYQAGDYDLAVGLLANKKVSVKELITGVYAFSDAEQAFEAAAAGKGIKTVISGVGI